MRKVLFFVFFNCFAFGQTHEVDSLKREINKDPGNFFVQRELINTYISQRDWKSAKSQSRLAQNVFKNSADYRECLRAMELLILMREDPGKSVETSIDQRLKQMKGKNFPLTESHLLFCKGLGYANQGDSKNSSQYFLKSVEILEKNKFPIRYFVNFFIHYGNSLILQGQYNKALPVFYKMLPLQPEKSRFFLYNSIGVCYYNLKDFKKAEHYYTLTVQHSNPENRNQLTCNLALLYLEKKEIKNAENTVRKIGPQSLTTADSTMYYTVKGEICRANGKYPDALRYFKVAKEVDERTQQYRNLATDYSSIGSVYLELKDYSNAKLNLAKAHQLGKEFYDERLIRESLKMLVQSDLRQRSPEYSQYFDEYVKMSDSISSKNLLDKTTEFEFEYQTAEKETKIAQQQLQLEKEKTKRNIAIAGIGTLVLLSGSGFWLTKSRQKRKELQSQNTLLELQQNLNEMELQSLNKQLDPHEIKNLLASISPEIQEKAPESYRKMLKLFNITKASLNNNSITDSVENQVQQIDDFLSLEKNMLFEPLAYHIDNKIGNENIQIPRLMLKNLVENAVKHGIKGKQDGGTIGVLLEESDGFIHISVDDTGKGRKAAISLDSGIGTSTYQRLFETLNKKNKQHASFDIFDKEQGTKVDVKIPINYQYS